MFTGIKQWMRARFAGVSCISAVVALAIPVTNHIAGLSSQMLTHHMKSFSISFIDSDQRIATRGLCADQLQCSGNYLSNVGISESLYQMSSTDTQTRTEKPLNVILSDLLNNNKAESDRFGDSIIITGDETLCYHSESESRQCMEW